MSRKTANSYLGEFELQRVLALIAYLANHKNDEGVRFPKLFEGIT